MVQHNQQIYEGKLSKIGLVPGYHGAITSDDPNSVSGFDYHINPMNPAADLSGARIRESDTILIDDHLDISHFREGDHIRYTIGRIRCPRIGSSRHWDYKTLPIITSIEKISQ